jgi:hypothetical protein
MRSIPKALFSKYYPAYMFLKGTSIIAYLAQGTLNEGEGLV